MEPEEWARRTRERRAAETLRPAEWVLEASEFTPAKVEVKKWRETMAHRSVNVVNHLALGCRHFSLFPFSLFTEYKEEEVTWWEYGIPM